MFTEENLAQGLQVFQGEHLVAILIAAHVVEGLRAENARLQAEAGRLQTEVLELRRALDAAREVDIPMIVLDKKHV